MKLNRAELRKVLYDFNSISNRLMQADFQDYNIALLKFIEFINKIEMAGSQKNQLTFTEKNREKNKRYKLEYDEEFEIYKFMEI